MKANSLRLLMAAAIALSAVACTSGSSALIPRAPTHAVPLQPLDVGGGILPGPAGGTGP